MWKYVKIASSNHHEVFGIQEDGSPITHRRFLNLLRDSSPFRRFYNQQLAECNFEAFLWENKPIARRNMDQAYECSLIRNTFLAGCSPDQKTFRQYFDPNKPAVTFPNLGGDARLIAPCPHSAPDCYTHIGAFVRKADSEQRDALWRITAEEALDAIGEEPRWLSTNGLGVFWLHMRIDRRPKYYQTKDYTALSSE